MSVRPTFAALALVAASLAALACGGTTTTSSGGTSAPTPAPGDAAAGDAAPKEGDRTQQGVYGCCAKGEGTACCEGKAQGTCFAYGGVYGDCQQAGEQVEGKVICGHCCAGLTRAAIEIVGDAGACVPDAPPSLFVCVQCGDGVCGAGENACTCPADCPG